MGFVYKMAVNRRQSKASAKYLSVTASRVLNVMYTRPFKNVNEIVILIIYHFIRAVTYFFTLINMTWVSLFLLRKEKCTFAHALSVHTQLIVSG